MGLYVAIVLMAEIAALPIGTHGPVVDGPLGVELTEIVWGTAFGLVIAHWFAFQVATQGIGRVHRYGGTPVVAELIGAALVCAIASIPILLLPDDTEQEGVLYVLAMVVGVVAYLVERANDRSRAASAAFGLFALIAGIAVATLKYRLAFH
jgi:hypothetical protein